MKADSMLALVGSRTGPPHSPDAVGTTPENAGANSFDEIWMALVAPPETTAIEPATVTDPATPPDDVSVDADAENPELVPDELVTDKEPVPNVAAEQAVPLPPEFTDATASTIIGTAPITPAQAEDTNGHQTDAVDHIEATQPMQPPIGAPTGVVVAGVPAALPPAAVAVGPSESRPPLRTGAVPMMAGSRPTGSEAATTSAESRDGDAQVKRASSSEAPAVYRTDIGRSKPDTPAGSNMSLASAGPATFAAPPPTATDGLGSTIASPTQTAPMALNALPETVSEGAALTSIRSVSTQHAQALENSAQAGPLVARNISSQIVAQLTPIEPGVTEITLSPEELGKLQLSISTRDGVVAIVMMAERPETNDLLRRHLDAIAQDFRAAGIDQLDLSMGDPSRDRSAQAQQDEAVQIAVDAPSDTATAGTHATATRAHTLLNDRLDLRM